VQISIAWPALVNGVAPLQLVVAGRVVRADGSRVAVHVSQHEFRAACDSYAGIPRSHDSHGIELVRPAELTTIQ